MPCVYVRAGRSPKNGLASLPPHGLAGTRGLAGPGNIKRAGSQLYKEPLIVQIGQIEVEIQPEIVQQTT